MRVMLKENQTTYLATALANESYIKNCGNCGKKIDKPVLYKGYVFCSNECKNAFESRLEMKK